MKNIQILFFFAVIYEYCKHFSDSFRYDVLTPDEAIGKVSYTFLFIYEG